VRSPHAVVMGAIFAAAGCGGATPEFGSRQALCMHSLTLVVVVNVTLFIFVAGTAVRVAWLGWSLAGPDSERGGGGPGVPRPTTPIPPRLPTPAPPWQPGGPDDLANSA
jgi:hypothetical protein